MKSEQSILVVEDEADLAELIAFNLKREGYHVCQVADGLSAVEHIEHDCPDLIVLDRMLPKLSGDEVAARMKRNPALSNVPIVMLTAKADEADELVGFALGADDYISKPFSIKLLLARVEAVLRRKTVGKGSEKVMTVGPVVLDESRHEVRVHGKPVSLTATEFRILECLMAGNGRVMNRENLINSVMGETVAVTDRTIDVHIAALRKKMADAANWIQTIRGVGYTFRAP